MQRPSNTNVEIQPTNNQKIRLTQTIKDEEKYQSNKNLYIQRIFEMDIEDLLKIRGQTRQLKDKKVRKTTSNLNIPILKTKRSHN